MVSSRVLKSALGLCIFVQAFALQAQTVEAGWKNVTMDQLKSAQKIFVAILEKDPANQSAISGLGECYYKREVYDSAALKFNQLISLKPDDAFYSISIEKVALQTGNTAAALLKLDELSKKNKKNYKVQLAISEAFIDGKIKDLEKASYYQSLAKTLNSSNARTFYIAGKIAILKENYNEATLAFEQAINFDSTLCDGYINLNNIYMRARNYKESLNYLTRAVRIDPEYIPLYKSLGNVYYEIAQYQKASDAYGKYIAKAEYTAEEEERYAYCLFFNKEYDKTLSVIKNLANDDAQDHILNRLTAYIYYEKGEYANALKAMDVFFTNVDSSKCIPYDFEYYGKTLSQLNNDSLAIVNFKKALAMDPTRNDLNEPIAKSYGKLKLYPESSKYYETLVANKSNVLASDYFILGRSYYLCAANGDSAVVDSLMRVDYLAKADSIFNKITIISPASYLGYFWRARTNALIDPESELGLAKPYYDKTIELLSISSTPDKYKKEFIEAYSYLGYYYYLNNDIPTSRLNWEKILAIDPVNGIAIKALEDMK